MAPSWTLLPDLTDENATTTYTSNDQAFRGICIKIQDLINHNSQTLNQIQQRKDQQITVGYEYQMKLSSESERNTSAPTMEIVTTPKTSTVGQVLKVWKRVDGPLEKDGLFLNYMDLSLNTFEDVARLIEMTHEVGNKYITFIIENYESTLSFELFVNNLEKLKVVLDQIQEATTDVVNTIGEDIELKRDMDQMMASYKKVCEKFPLTLELSGNHKIVNDTMKVHEQQQQQKGHIPVIQKISTLACHSTHSLHKGHVFDMKVYDINGEKFMATAGAENTIKIIRLKDKVEVAILNGHSSYIFSLVLFKNVKGEQCLASCGMDGVKLWNLQDNKFITSLENSKDSTRAAAYGLASFVKDGKPVIACGYNNGEIKLWCAESKTLLSSLTGHKGWIYALTVFNQDGQMYLASAGEDSTIKVWNSTTNKLVKTLNNVHEKGVWSLLSFEHDGIVYIASGGAYRAGNIKVWNVTQKYTLMTTFTGHPQQVVSSLKILEHNGSPLLISSSNNCMVMWGLSEGRMIHTLNCEDCEEIWSIEVYQEDEKGLDACVVLGSSKGNVTFVTKK